MKKLFIISILLSLMGCTSTGGKSVLDRIEFDPDEYGCAVIDGFAQIGGTLGFGSTTASVTVKKVKDTVTEADGTIRKVDVPEC